MTNGEKLKEIFPNGLFMFKKNWLNAEYKEPTTKNDLGVDCISRADAIRVASGYCHPSNVAKELAKLPSITPQPTRNDLGVDYIDRAKVQTEIEMSASRYTIARERCGMGQVEWSDQLIKVSDAVDIIRNLPSVTPQEPFINKPCVSSGVCKHDKNKVLDEIKAEIKDIAFDWQEIDGEHESFMVVDLNDALNIIDKYKAESEG